MITILLLILAMCLWSWHPYPGLFATCNPKIHNTRANCIPIFWNIGSVWVRIGVKIIWGVRISLKFKVLLLLVRGWLLRAIIARDVYNYIPWYHKDEKCWFESCKNVWNFGDILIQIRKSHWKTRLLSQFTTLQKLLLVSEFDFHRNFDIQIPTRFYLNCFDVKD